MRVSFNQGLYMKKNNCTFSGSSTEKNVSSLINTDRMVDSFISMAKIDTGSKEKFAEKGIIPSTDKQKVFANILIEKLNKLGLSEINMDDHYIVTATLDSNIEKNSPVVGLLAHMDTNEDAPTGPVKPIIRDYKSGDIKLTKAISIPANDLKDYQNQKIITTNGKTLLGADDKAGIAEILEAINVFKENPNLKHPKIRIAFTPDEETGEGALKFNIKSFGADVAYTIDGKSPHEIEDESFNAFNPKFTVEGHNIHTGYAKDKMINSVRITNWILSKLPENEIPEKTEEREGFFHLHSIKGDESKTKVEMLIRDHDYDTAVKRVELLKDIIEQARKIFGCKIVFDPNQKYLNMKTKIDELPEVIEYAKEGIEKSGLKPKTIAIRGGTDGSYLSLNGLLTPNLGAGSHNFHSKTEFLPIEEMKKCTENIINIMAVWAEKSKEIMPKILARRM